MIYEDFKQTDFVSKLFYQKIPSKMLATVKEDCVNTTIRIMCVHAYWPN